MPERIIRYLLKNRLSIVLLTTLLSCFFLSQALKLSFDSSLDVWFLQDDPNLVTYHQFLERFNGDEVLVLGIFSDDVFSPNVISAIDRLTRKAGSLSAAHRATSITNVKVIDGESDFIEITPLITKNALTKQQAQQIKEKALKLKSLEGLINSTATAAAIFIELDKEHISFAGKIKLTQKVRALAMKEKQNGILDFALAGHPFIDEAFYIYNQQDTIKLVPLSFLAIFLILLFIYRDLSLTLAPMFIVFLADLWVMGFMSLFGFKMNIITPSILGVILAVGVADSVHILSDYIQQTAKGKNKEKAIQDSFVSLWKPCLITTITTMAGLASLLVSQLQPVREMGLLSTLGVGLAFILSMGLIPILLSYLPLQKKQHATFFYPLLKKLSTPSLKNSRRILFFVLLFSPLFFWSSLQIEVGSNVLNYFKKNDPVRTSTLRVENELGGAASVEFFISGADSTLKDPAHLKKLDNLTSWLKTKENGVSHFFSFLDSLKNLNQKFHDDNQKFYRIPETKELLAQLFLILEGEPDFDLAIQDNYSVGRISMRVLYQKASELVKIIPDIEKHISENYSSPDFKITMTGFVKLMADMESYLIESQIISFSLALIVVTLMLAFLFRSFKTALFSMIPNIFPVFFGLAFMGLMGLALDTGTVMISSLCIGIVVDDTVHFLSRYRQSRKQKQTIQEAIKQAIYRTGQPIIITSLVLICGFLVMTMGRFNPNVNFGLVSAVVILMAVIADLVILPAALVVWGKKEGKKSSAKSQNAL